MRLNKYVVNPESGGIFDIPIKAEMFVTDLKSL